MQKFDLYWYDMVFQEDLLKEDPQSKRRPILVLDKDLFVTITMITGTNNKNYYEIRDWEEAGLSKPSYINFDRELLVNAVELSDYIGHLSENDIHRIKSQNLVEVLAEDTKKKSNGKWVNKGTAGEHGEFKTKKAADAQRRAIFASGWHN